MQEQYTILAVDDNPMNLDILVNLLKEYEMCVALSAKSRLNLLQNHKVDLVLLDVMMPNMDGIEMIKILKSKPSTRDIPVVLLSANYTQESIDRGFHAGAVDYIFKPFNPQELLTSVHNHLEHEVH